jgi:signal transduction histidine kinase
MRPVVPPVPAFSSPARSAGYALAVAIVLAGLWLTSAHSYLLFHSITEIFIVAVALAVFMVSWSARGYPETQPFVLLGIGYLFVAILETLHALTYQGMNILPVGQDYATKLWVSARGLQAVVTLAFVVLVRLRRTAPTVIAALAVGALAAFAVLSIFAWDIFPRCLVEGVGVTPFKKASEYAIATLLLTSAILVLGKIETIDRQERILLAAAFALNAAAEIVFTHYVSAYGTQNLVGHLLTLGSFLLAYEALFATKIRGRMALTHELQRSTSRLEASEAELRAANLSKDRFLSIIAHDLRNSVSGFLSLTEVLAGQFSRLEKKRIHELCVLLHDGARRSSELLESILQWANAQTGRLVAKPSTFALDELCEGIVAQHGAVARRKGIALESRVPVPSIVRADPDMVATIIRNLVANALKFTPGGGSVVVDASRDGAWQRISVADTGCGMSADDTAKLFRIDVRLATEGTEGERGSGIGLILCHELAALNRGRIEVKSEPGKGSTFALALPADAETAAPGPSGAGGSTRPARGSAVPRNPAR